MILWIVYAYCFTFSSMNFKLFKPFFLLALLYWIWLFRGYLGIYFTGEKESSTGFGFSTNCFPPSVVVRPFYLQAYFKFARSPPQVSFYFSFYFLNEQFIYLFILRSDTESYLTTSSPICIRDSISQTTAFRISERPTMLSRWHTSQTPDPNYNRTSIRRRRKAQ